MAPAQKYLTWNQFESFIHDAVTTVNQLQKKPTGVYGLPRGGLPIAVTLSHRLGIPLLLAPTPGCIVVDDISDTGTTLQHYLDSGYIIITWATRAKWTKVVPFFSGLVVNDDSWLVFPWEQDNFVEPFKKKETENADQ